MGLVIVLGVAFRFYGLDDKYFWFDEIASGLWYSGHDVELLRAESAGQSLRPTDYRDMMQLDDGSSYGAVIRQVAENDPQHTPLYYLALRGWAGLAGDSIGALRALSGISGVLLLPLLYLLCKELTGNRRTAWIAVVLVAVSPFHVVYAQEARQYTFWLIWIALNSLLLLRAERESSATNWLLYALAAAVALYTQLLHLLVIAAHGVYLLTGNRRQTWLPFCLAGGLAGLLFTPWLVLLLGNLGTAQDHLSWSATPVSAARLLGMWAYNYSALFFDPNLVGKYYEGSRYLLLASYALRLLLLVPAALACLALLRCWRSRTSRFLLPLILVPFLGLALPDLLLGGMRSGGGNRYLAPSYLALQITLAWWLATRLPDRFPRGTTWRNGILVVLVLAGTVSGILFNRSENWWHKTIYHDAISEAEIINQGKNRLVVESEFGRLLALANLLDDDIRMVYRPAN